MAACSYAIQGAAKHAPATVLAGQQLVRLSNGTGNAIAAPCRAHCVSACLPAPCVSAPVDYPKSQRPQVNALHCAVVMPVAIALRL